MKTRGWSVLPHAEVHAGLDEGDDLTDVGRDRQALRHDDVEAQEARDLAVHQHGLVVELGRDDLDLVEQIALLLRADDQRHRVGFEVHVVVAEDALGLDQLRHGQAARGGRAEGVATGTWTCRTSRPTGRWRPAPIWAVAKAAAMMQSSQARPTALARVLDVLRLRVHDGLQLIEAVDQLVDLAVLREHPAALEVGVGAVLRGEAAGGGLQLHRGDVVGRRRLLADVEALADLAAQLAAHLLEPQLQVRAELGRPEFEKVLGHAEYSKPRV
jgi:hypothetical protein